MAESTFLYSWNWVITVLLKMTFNHKLTLTAAIPIAEALISTFESTAKFFNSLHLFFAPTWIRGFAFFA